MTRVAVIMGGWSSERPVSLSSGRGMAEAARVSGFDVVEIDVTRHLAQQLEQAKPDVVLNALHGPWGEDGCVQGVLEVMGIPYTHSGVLASALAMNKDKARAVYAQHGLDIAEGGLYAVEDLARDHIMPPPYVIKPIAEGSSFGVFIVREGANRPPRELTDGTWQFGSHALVEKFVPGRELTVGVMGDRAMAVTEAALAASLRAHRALGCRGVSRSDFRYDEKAGRLVILETNTQPGMTPTSLIPEQAAHLGIDYPSLVRWMIEDASCPR